MWNVWERGEVYKRFWGGNLWEKAHLEDGRTILKWSLKK
jgi:hypothetical protein